MNLKEVSNIAVIAWEEALQKLKNENKVLACDEFKYFVEKFVYEYLTTHLKEDLSNLRVVVYWEVGNNWEGHYRMKIEQVQSIDIV